MVYQQTSSISTGLADPELEVHSVDEDKPTLKYGMPVMLKPTAAVNNIPSTSTINTNKHIKSATGVKSGSLVDGANAKTSRCNEYGYDVTDSEDCGDSKVDLGYHFTWSDEDEPSFLDQQGFGSNVYESIRAISKEASKKIDAVLAVDHVDQLHEELRKVRSEMKRRRDEHSELKGIVQMKDHQIGTLELERDLYKADTAKLANDLETCLLKFRSLVGPLSPTRIHSNTFENEAEQGMESKATGASNPSERKEHMDESNSKDSSVPMASSTLPLQLKRLRTQKVTVQAASSLSHETGSDTASTTSNKSVSTVEVSTPSRLAVVVPETPKELEQQATFPSQGAPELDPRLSNEMTSTQQRHKKTMLFALCRCGTNAKKKVYSLEEPASLGVYDSAFHRQINRNHVVVPEGKHPITPQMLHRPHGILHSQVEDMDRRLHSSIKTSEDLRRRVAMLHLYYERHENCGERSFVGKPDKQFDLTGQSIQRLRSSTISDIEPKQDQANNDVQSLRKLRVVTFNV
jgi:hypothetical protein